MREKRDDGPSGMFFFSSEMSGHKREQKEVDGLKVAQHSSNFIVFVPIHGQTFLKPRMGDVCFLLIQVAIQANLCVELIMNCTPDAPFSKKTRSERVGR